MRPAALILGARRKATSKPVSGFAAGSRAAAARFSILSVISAPSQFAFHGRLALEGSVGEILDLEAVDRLRSLPVSSATSCLDPPAPSRASSAAHEPGAELLTIATGPPLSRPAGNDQAGDVEGLDALPQYPAKPKPNSPSQLFLNTNRNGQ